ncbi:AAA family ATPase [Stutzerimonas nitrititolerans]|uniref:AAA family ATPase n=1 Tax=Stutzerimonas nitrititolerans TaxID=2482751 RepID=UPI0028A7ADA0|nr:AAA family ATPase [Stutzerimonas nitrititolerans]
MPKASLIKSPPAKTLPEGKPKKELGFEDNKTIPIKSITGIDIKLFRSISNQEIKLGSHITVLSGRNGSLKTSLMGLIAHPFTSEAKDAFGNPLKTSLREVFKLSPSHDNVNYEYNLILETTTGEYLSEPVSIYWVGDQTNRHRVVVSGAEKGDGNFTYNTSFLNLKRLYPLVDTNATLVANDKYPLTPTESRELKDYYEKIFPSSHYSVFGGVYKAKYKTTYAPTGEDSKYDWHTISSGEDNLGAIFNRLLGFQRAFKKGQVNGNGVICIDEFESSLHPVAQLCLFDYLFRWSAKFKVQVVISTHSLGLISDIYQKYTNDITNNRISLNFVSKSLASNGSLPILHNPPFELAYKELTLKDPTEAVAARKIKILCEDDIAVHYAKRLIKSTTTLKSIEFCSSLDTTNPKPGMSYTELKPLATMCARFPVLMDRTIALLDPDVPKNFTDKIKNKDLFLILPDPENLAIERRIVAWIISMDNGDDFFKKFGERERFLLKFKEHGIESLTYSEVISEHHVDIAKCKNWAHSNLQSFKKYLTHYTNNYPDRNLFVSQFVAALNKLNAAAGLPEIKP